MQGSERWPLAGSPEWPYTCTVITGKASPVWRTALTRPNQRNLGVADSFFRRPYRIRGLPKLRTCGGAARVEVLHVRDGVQLEHGRAAGALHDDPVCAQGRGLEQQVRQRVREIPGREAAYSWGRTSAGAKSSVRMPGRTPETCSSQMLSDLALLVPQCGPK